MAAKNALVFTKSPSDVNSKCPQKAHLGFWLRFVSNHVSICFQQLLEAKGVTVIERGVLRTLLARGETRHVTCFGRKGETHVERFPG